MKIGDKCERYQIIEAGWNRFSYYGECEVFEKDNKLLFWSLVSHVVTMIITR